MLQKLDFLVRFWQLRARHHALGTPLSEAECGELWSLLRLVALERGLPNPGPPPNNDHGIPVQLTAPGGFVAGDVRRIFADGLVVACVRPLPTGSSTIARLADAVTGVEFTLPCEVEWTFVASPSAMCLRINGSPTRATFAIPQPGMWRSPLGLGSSASHRA
jgi:hypothetical protein